MVVFFSGTGNSRYCARLLAAGLGDELIDSFHFIRDGVAAELLSERPWVFVSPTYAWQLPRVFADFLRGGSFTGCKAAYFVMTCGDGIGGAGKKISSLCEEKGLEYRGVLKVLMPENYIAMYEAPGAAESADIVSAARPVLEAGLDAIRQDRPFPAPEAGIFDSFKTGVINPVFYRFIVKAGPFRATDACVGCGKCERGCPMNNIRLENGRPVWGGSCTHCMACICACPSEAVEYGKKSRGKPRYQCPEYGE